MTPLLNIYKAAVFEKANAQLTLKNLPLKAPSAGKGVVKVLATEVCHPDAGVQVSAFRNSLPITPDHEIIGNIAAVSDGEKK
jgi:D-arabinose 1-dehydrogenase-like Zn-dependent alcohol dehydrogenase